METRLQKKRKAKTRPLTRNEKILLTLLGIIIFIWGSFRFLIGPQREKIETLENEKVELNLQIEDINRTLRKEKKIDEEFVILHRERDQILANYFPTLDQAQIIYMLNDLVEDERVVVNDINFSRPAGEKIGDLDVRAMDISIPYNGKYEGIMDILRAINSSPRRILVNSLAMDKASSSELAGNMSLKIYSLEGLAETDPNIIYIDTVDNFQNEKPFQAYESYEANASTEGNGSTGSGGSSGTEGPGYTEIQGTILTDFEYGSYDFIPSNNMIKGNTVSSTISKSGKYSLRFEYNILALDYENRAYIDLSKDNAILKYPPNSIGMWVYSYGYSPGTLGLRLKDPDGEEIDIKLTEGISWMGWSYVETRVPQDLKLYPLTVDKIYFEIPYNRDDFGVLLLDKLEVYYYDNLIADEEEVNSSYIHYVVENGDNISNISNRFYGTKNRKNEIMKLNDIGPGDILPVGKVLVLPKP